MHTISFNAPAHVQKATPGNLTQLLLPRRGLVAGVGWGVLEEKQGQEAGSCARRPL